MLVGVIAQIGKGCVEVWSWTDDRAMKEPIGSGPRPARMQRRILALAFFATLVTIAAPAAQVYACSCAQLGLGEALANADVAFTGVVTGLRDPNAGNPLVGSGDPIVYVFAVESVAKGPAANQITITSARDGASCGMTFALADKWRIYAYADGAGGLATGICSGNALITANAPLPVPPPAGLPIELLAVGGVVIGLVGFSAWAFTRRPGSSVS